MNLLLNILSLQQKNFRGFMEHYQLRAPLGSLLLQSVCKQAGHQADLVDQRVRPTKTEDWVDSILAQKYDAVGISTYSWTRAFHARAIRALRKRYRGKIFVGGPAVLPSTVDFWLDAGADVAVLGEGERTLVELLDKMESDRPLEDTAGTAIRNEYGKTVRCAPRPILSIEELEKLPYPAWTREHTRTYIDNTAVNVRRPAASMITTRGCLYKCAFCGAPVIWQGIRQRSVASVMDEIDWLVENFQIRHLAFMDDIFGLNAPWVFDFCDQLSRRPYYLSWMIDSHPLSFGSRREEVFRAMAKAGLSFVSFGAQSADDQVLRNINRSPKEIPALEQNIALCRDLGIATSLAYIFGLPGDTPRTARKAIDFALKTRPLVADFHPLWYIEGSELADRYPECDANPYSYEQQKKWSNQARRKFYFHPAVLLQFFVYVLKHNPKYLLKLVTMAFFGIPQFLFEQKTVTLEETGDKRSIAPVQ